MLNSTKFISAATALFFCFFLFTCTSESESLEDVGANSNLEVVYSVEFPFLKDKTLLKWFPTEYATILSKNELFGEMNSKMNVICNRFYANEKDKVIFQTLENMSGKYSCEMEEVDVTKFINSMPEMIISAPRADTTILGIKCQVAMAEFKIDSVPPVKLYYTNELDIENPNWYNQYREINGFLMGYEIEQFGMRMKLMAKSLTKVNKPILSDLVFGERKSENYQHKNPQELKEEIQDMIDDFME